MAAKRRGRAAGRLLNSYPVSVLQEELRGWVVLRLAQHNGLFNTIELDTFKDGQDGKCHVMCILP